VKVGVSEKSSEWWGGAYKREQEFHYGELSIMVFGMRWRNEYVLCIHISWDRYKLLYYQQLIPTHRAEQLPFCINCQLNYPYLL
jgi:hypothetical protein